MQHGESLVLFRERWQGTASGIEGWFKVEFVAAIGPEVAAIRTGGAGGRGRGGATYPDLIVEPVGSPAEPIRIELKAGGHDWWLGGSDARDKYRGCLLAFLLITTTPICATHEAKVKQLDEDAQLAKICEVTTSQGSRSFYFGMADLRY